MLQSDDPAVQWQLNLYRDVVVKSEEPVNPEHTVSRVQSISAALFHLELVGNKTQREKNELFNKKKKKKHCHMGNVSKTLNSKIDFSVGPPQVEQPLRNKKCVLQKLLSKQRKRAVVACFRMAPLYNLPRSVFSPPGTLQPH